MHSNQFILKFDDENYSRELQYPQTDLFWQSGSTELRTNTEQSEQLVLSVQFVLSEHFEQFILSEQGQTVLMEPADSAFYMSAEPWFKAP